MFQSISVISAAPSAVVSAELDHATNVSVNVLEPTTFLSSHPCGFADVFVLSAELNQLGFDSVPDVCPHSAILVSSFFYLETFNTASKTFLKDLASFCNILKYLDRIGVLRDINPL